MLYFHIIFLLCYSWIATSNGSLTMKMMKNRSVVITGPQDVTIFLKSSNKLVVAWTLPQIYVSHDVYGKAFEQLKNGDKVNVLKPLFRYDPKEVADAIAKTETTKKPNGTESNNTNTADNTTDGGNVTSVDVDSDDKKNDTSNSSIADNKEVKPTETASDDKDDQSESTTTITKRAAQIPANLNHVVCRALTEFADFTVAENAKPGVMDNGWAISLLDSDLDIPATNMSIFYTEKVHKIVKFEEGCVDRLEVKWTIQNSRPLEEMVVLNASDHLYSINDLKPGKEYKIVVTAHFVSGDSISSKAIYVTTLLTGFQCRCDWHGTVNQTSDCVNPSSTEQHCECHDSYTGRFCEDCSTGFYRRTPNDMCKKCPCGEHGAVKSSCRFVEGFPKCDHCAKGYTGNLCHKCDHGYFRFKKRCRKCLCNGNVLPDAPSICDPVTGSCIDCINNSTGYYCERCLPGYRRYPHNNGTCYHLNDVKNMQPPLSKSDDDSSSGVKPGVIGAVVVVLVLSACVIVGLFVCHRVRANRQRRALWTVEMRPDNDDLDFNSVHNEDARMDEIDDMAFYDRQTGRTKTGGKYSKLTEEI